MLSFRRKLGRQNVGRRGERVAARWLRRNGFKIIGRNVRVGVGEADIVCLDRDRRTVVVVEVKARMMTSQRTPRPERNVGQRKQHKLRQVTASIRQKYKLQDRPVRIDVVGVEFHRGRRPVIRHHPRAV